MAVYFFWDFHGFWPWEKASFTFSSGINVLYFFFGPFLPVWKTFIILILGHFGYGGGRRFFEWCLWHTFPWFSVFPDFSVLRHSSWLTACQVGPSALLPNRIFAVFCAECRLHFLSRSGVPAPSLSSKTLSVSVSSSTAKMILQVRSLILAFLFPLLILHVLFRGPTTSARKLSLRRSSGSAASPSVRRGLMEEGDSVGEWGERDLRLCNLKARSTIEKTIRIWQTKRDTSVGASESQIETTAHYAPGGSTWGRVLPPSSCPEACCSPWQGGGRCPACSPGLPCQGPCRRARRQGTSRPGHHQGTRQQRIGGGARAGWTGEAGGASGRAAQDRQAQLATPWPGHRSEGTAVEWQSSEKHRPNSTKSSLRRAAPPRTWTPPPGHPLGSSPGKGRRQPRQEGRWGGSPGFRACPLFPAGLPTRSGSGWTATLTSSAPPAPAASLGTRGTKDT